MAEESTADEKIIDEARKRFKRCSEWESTFRQRYVADLKFCDGDSENLWQWEDALYKARVAQNKPALTINKTRQSCLQIVNDQRQNKSQIKIRPVGDGATYDAAKIWEGICRHVEYQSNAMETYDSAAWSQVVGGYGAWRVVTRYVDDKSFDQEVYIQRVPDALSVYLDPDIQEFDGSDAKFGFVFRDIERDEFEAEYPELKDAVPKSQFSEDEGWNDEHHVRICEYYRRTEKPDHLLHVRVPGTDHERIVPKSVLQKDLAKHPMNMGPDGKPIDENPEIPEETIQRSRETTRVEIEWFKIAGDKIIERNIWLGSYIPLVRVIGEETVIEGNLDRKGHTRALRDPQRTYNYYSSAAVEFAAGQTKTPYLGPIAAFEGLERYWDNANIETLPYLPFNSHDDQGQPIPAPQRIQPPVSHSAALEGMKIAQNEMMMASGQYQSQFGENENAKSGVAINARQRQGDNATYHYIDHLAQAIRFTGRILIDLVPKIYDTPRVIKIMAEDGDQSEVNVQPDAGVPHQQVLNGQPIDKKAAEQAQGNPDLADKIKTIFDPNVGTYDVESDIGPAYATRRQEAFAAFSQIMSQNPEAMKIGADIMFRAADFPMSDELAERFKRSIPPAILGQGPPPEVQQMQQQAQQAMQQAQQQIQALQHTIVALQSKVSDKTDDQQSDTAKSNLDQYRAETDRMKALGSIDPDAMIPVIRQLISEALGTPIVPLMGQHAVAEQAFIPQQPPNAGQGQPSPGPDGQGQPQPPQASPGPPQGAPQPAPNQPPPGGFSLPEQPPVPGAQKAPDGHWYVEAPHAGGRFQRVDDAPTDAG